MTRIQFTATFPSIDPGDLEAFERLATEAVERVRSESGCLQYDWFLNEDRTRCVVRETYADSDAILAHLGNVGELVGRIVPLGGGLELEVFGSPSAEVTEALTALSPTYHSLLVGK